MARGNPLVDKEKLKEAEGRFDPNLRDEGAGFFSTLFTAGSNIGSDAVTELGYIAQAVARPIDTGEAVLRVLAGYAQKALPDDWEAYLPEDWATNKVYANAINDYYADKYGSLEQAADSFAEQPVSVALDAFAVKALLTTVSKQAAKRSAATTKMANTAKGTVMEGELASRAAAELKVAQELERTVKYEGKLVWDDALGAYVPESSVVKPKIDAEEVAPVVAAIEDAVPNNNPAVANVADDSISIEALDAREKARRAQLSPELRAMEDAILVERMNSFSDPNFTMVGATTTAEEAAKRMASSKEGMITGTRNQTVAPALATQAENMVADASKLTRDKQRMADDDIMAAATQADLFENGSAAAYEAYQASQLANRAAQTSAVATTVPKGMMTSKVAGPIARTKDIDIPPPRTTPKPVNQTETVIKPANVLPAIQRVGSAANQLTGDRDIDGSLIPMAPDKGIDLIADEPLAIKSKYKDMPPYEKSIDNRDISGGKDKANTKPGWFQGSSVEGTDDGNYWSADFEDEHWNTPAGVQEAIGIWGRPIGNKIGNPIRSWN